MALFDDLRAHLVTLAGRVRAPVRRLIAGLDYPDAQGVLGVQESAVTSWAGWDMPAVQAALDGARVGNLQAIHQLLLQMEEDPLIAHGLALRGSALVGTPFRLERRRKELPERAFRALQEHWPECFSDGDLATSAQYRVALGVAPAQVTWHLQEGLWMPRISILETGNLRWDDEIRRFRFQAKGKGEIIVEDDGREWVLFCELAAKYPYLYGALRSLAVVWWVKAACIRYLHNYARVHGSPIRKVKAPASQRESEDFKALIKQAQTLFGGGVFTAPQYDGPSFDLELVEAESQSYGVFETAIRLADNYITLRLLGAVDNTSGLSGQGSRARAEVHERQSMKFLGSDCRVTARAETKVLRQWCLYNRFEPCWAPVPCFDHAPPADQGELADTRTKNAQALGVLVDKLPLLAEQAPDVQVDWRALLEEHGVPLRQEDEAAPRDSKPDNVQPDQPDQD